ncbi:hypothetical protein D3C85_1021630 [compost metagenome]
MRLTTQVEAFREGLGEGHVGDGAAVGDAAQGGLQRLSVAAGLDDHIGAQLIGQLLDLHAQIDADGIEAVVGAVLEGDLAAVRQGIDPDDDGGTGLLGQLHGDLADGAEAHYDHKVTDADVAITHTAHGELGRVVANRVLPARAFRQIAQLVVVDRIDDDGLLQRGIGADHVAERKAGDVAAHLADGADDHVAQLELAEHDATGGIGRTRHEHVPLGIEHLVDEGAVPAEIHRLSAVFRGAVNGFDFHLMGRHRTILIFHQCGDAGFNCNQLFH